MPVRANSSSMLEVVASPIDVIREQIEKCTRAGLQLKVIDIQETALRNLAVYTPENQRGIALFDSKPEEVRVYDFIDPELGKVAPYGVYDVTNNTGWVSIGIDHDTAEFAVESIRRWWREMGVQVYPTAHRLLITADCGGSNGNRVRLWRRELQKLADELQLTIQVCHLPPGTSKWNKIEHRMFCHITVNWRGRPLVSRQVVVNLIGSTTTQAGLCIKAALDEKNYAQGIKVSDDELATLALERDDFHGEWNYRLRPRI